MHRLKPEFDLPKLRRQLEEILAIVNRNGAALDRGANDGTIFPVHESASLAEPREAHAGTTSGSEMDCQRLSFEDGRSATPDDLYKDALVVLTEFGQASPTILQMWLSIDYGSAITILHRFQAEGLISSKGRVRHKAFTLLRSLDQQT